MHNTTGNLYTTSSLRNGGRKAGMGMSYDNYDDESGCTEYDDLQFGFQVRFPNDGVDPEELNGPVTCYKASKNA